MRSQKERRQTSVYRGVRSADGRAGHLLLNDSCDGGSGRRSDRDWIGAILKASIHNGLGMIQNNGRWSDTERKRDERQR